MEIYSRLYIGEEAKPKEKKIISKLKKGKMQIGVYVITLPIGDNDLLEIYSAAELTQKFYHRISLKVVGIAGSYMEAVVLAGQIINEIYENTGGFDTREYLK